MSIHPVCRVLTALLIAASAFVMWRPAELAALYALIFAGICIAGIGRQHLRFIGGVALPLLVALLVVWGLVAKPPGSTQLDGVSYALSIWFRVAVLGGVFQWLLLPLVERPLHFRSFLDALHISGGVGTLLVTPILFLPEVRRRMDRLVDARKAQGFRTTGLEGLRSLPSTLTPLIASLLESALARAELWSHRGLLASDRTRWARMPYHIGRSLGVTAIAAATLGTGILTWR